MPTYEYLCRACGDRREVVQSFTDDPLTVCEACGGELRKVFSAAGLIFKGSGWHIKDYSSGSSGSASSSGSSSSGASSSGPSASSTSDTSSSAPSTSTGGASSTD